MNHTTLIEIIGFLRSKYKGNNTPEVFMTRDQLGELLSTPSDGVIQLVPPPPDSEKWFAGIIHIGRYSCVVILTDFLDLESKDYSDRGFGTNEGPSQKEFLQINYYQKYGEFKI